MGSKCRLSLEALEPRLLLSVAPVVTDANIDAFIATDGGTADVANIGDVVAVTWDNSASGDNNADIASVTADLSAFGGPAAAPMVDNGTGGDATPNDGIWTASYTIQAGTAVDTVVNATVTAVNTSALYTTTPDTSDITLNNLPAPTVTDGNIDVVLSTDAGTPDVANVGDVVTITWDNSASGDNNPDIMGVTTDVSQFGGTTALAMVDDGTGGDATAGDGIWTAQYTIAAGSAVDQPAYASVTATNVNDDATTVADTNAIQLDNLLPPTVTGDNIQVAISTDNGTTGVADIGDVITVTWDNSSTGDNNQGIATVTADLSQFGGPASVAMVDNGTGGDTTGGDNTWTARYTILPGDTASQTANASVTATNTADQSDTATGTSDISVNNGPVTTFSSGATLVSVYDLTGSGSIAATDVRVNFGPDDGIQSIVLRGHDSLEGLGIVVSGAPYIDAVRDHRGGTPATIGFIAADTTIGSVELRTGFSGYDLNGLTLGGLTFASDIDGDGSTTDATGLYDTGGAMYVKVKGDVTGDIWLGGNGIDGLTLTRMVVKHGDLAGDTNVEGDAHKVRVYGGDFTGNLDVTGSLHKLAIVAYDPEDGSPLVGGNFAAGANVTIGGTMDLGRIMSYSNSNSSVSFGIDLGALGRLKLAGSGLHQGDLPFNDGDFGVVVA